MNKDKGLRWGRKRERGKLERIIDDDADADDDADDADDADDGDDEEDGGDSSRGKLKGSYLGFQAKCTPLNHLNQNAL